MTPPDPQLLYAILGFTVLGAVLSTAAGGVYLLLPQRWRERSVAHLISLATGTLLAVSFMDLLPEALDLAGHDATEEILSINTATSTTGTTTTACATPARS